MILSICPNPSIDCTMELDSLNVGMLNRIRSKIETYSGKALNVAMGVARLNEKSFATGFMFDGHGKLFEQTLEKEGVDFKFVYSPGNARVNYKIIDNKSMLTEINDKGDEVKRDRQLALISLIEEVSKNASVAVMSGSLPGGVAPDFYREALSVIPKGVKTFVDTEEKNMKEALKTPVYLVKPNLRELESFTGERVTTIKDAIRLGRKYLDYGVQLVLISMGADGAILTDGSNSYYCKSANVAVNSTVGAGDCMVAAAAVFTEKGADMQEVLRRSVAAGTAAITTSGTNLFYKDKYEEIYSKIYTEKINL